MSSVYQINKGINRPIVFKGLKAQYISYLAVGLVLLLIAFAVLFISGVNLYVILSVIGGIGAFLFFATIRLSHRFGEHGLSKFLAKRNLPQYLKFRSRRLFTKLKTNQS